MRAAGVRDWVVLCEFTDRPEVLVCAVPVAAASEPATWIRLTWKPSLDVGCDGWLALADPAAIRRMLTRHRGPQPKPPVGRAEAARPVQAGLLDGLCDPATVLNMDRTPVDVAAAPPGSAVAARHLTWR